MSKILEILSFPWLNGVGVFIGIVGLIAYFYSRSESKLTYQRRGIRLIDKNIKLIPEEIKILFKNKEITSLAKTWIVLWNSGNKTILGDSIVDSDKLRIVFDSDSQILNYSIIKKTRECNKTKIVKNSSLSNELIITFDYFDAMDGVTVEILHTDIVHIPQLIGSVKGIPRGVLDGGPIQFNRPRGRALYVVIYTIATLLFLLLLVFPNKFESIIGKNSGSPEQRFGLIALVLFMLLTNMPELLRLKRPFPLALAIDEVA